MTLEIVKEPVATADGQVDEKSAIQQWFRRRHDTSPSTGLQLPSLVLKPELPLQRAIEEYSSYRPELVRKELDILSLQTIAESLEEERRAKSSRLIDPQESDAVRSPEEPSRDS